MEDFALHTILAEIWVLVADANRYFASQEPWRLRKTDPARMNTVLYVTAQVLGTIAIMAQPFIPAGAEKLLDLLAVPGGERSFACAGGRALPKAGTAIRQPEAIFPRYLEREA
jgi:methionyl-tRNA synthetase